MTDTLEQQIRRALGLDLVAAARQDGAWRPAAKSAARSGRADESQPVPDDAGSWSLAQLLHGRVC